MQGYSMWMPSIRQGSSVSGVVCRKALRGSSMVKRWGLGGDHKINQGVSITERVMACLFLSFASWSRGKGAWLCHVSAMISYLIIGQKAMWPNKLKLPCWEPK